MIKQKKSNKKLLTKQAIKLSVMEKTPIIQIRKSKKNPQTKETNT